MFSLLREFFLPWIIWIVTPTMKDASWKEIRVCRQFKEGVGFKKCKTKKPMIIALVGLTTTGKTSVAEDLAEHIGAVIIKSDVIRVMLQKHKARCEYACVIAESVALEIVEQGGSVVFDADFVFVDAGKRAILRATARKAGVPIVFIRTYCASDAEKPPCEVLANINTTHKAYLKHGIEECVEKLLA